MHISYEEAGSIRGDWRANSHRKDTSWDKLCELLRSRGIELNFVDGESESEKTNSESDDTGVI